MKIIDIRTRQCGRRTVQGRPVERCPMCGQPAVYLDFGRCDCGSSLHGFCHVAGYDRTNLRPRVVCTMHAHGGIN